MIARTRGEAALIEAEHFSSQGNWVRASAKYAETLNYLPNNQAAMDGLAEAQTMLNQQSTLTDTEQRIREQRQKALIEFDDAFAQAQAQLAQGNYVISNRAIVQAKLKLSNSRGVLTVAEFERLNLRSSQLIEQIEEERIAQAALEAQARIEQASQDKSTAERRASAQRERLIAENMRRVRQLQMELKYREALQVIDEILFIDPNNAAALTLRDIMLTTELYVDYAEMTRQREWTYAEMDRKGMAATIGIAPNISGPGPKSKSGLISYPEDWPQITMMRAGVGWANLSAEDQMAMHRMDNTAIPVQFAQHDFSQTMRFFEQVTEAPMYVDWKALNTIGVAKDTPVDVHLAEMPASRALTVSLSKWVMILNAQSGLLRMEWLLFLLNQHYADEQQQTFMTFVICWPRYHNSTQPQNLIEMHQAPSVDRTTVRICQWPRLTRSSMTMIKQISRHVRIRLIEWYPLFKRM